jgi:hypothetical protein
MTSPCHPRKLFVFAALSLADLGLTAFLLQRGEGRAYESNPVAAWWLERFGWAGLAGFKTALVLLAAAAALLVSRRRPQVGGRIITFACSVLSAVVLYSACLVTRVAAEADSERAALTQAERQRAGLVDSDRRILERIAAKGRLAEEVAEGRLGLLEAAARFRDLNERSHVGDEESYRLNYPGGSAEERSCREVISYVREALDCRRGDPAVVARLETELNDRLSGGLRLPAARAAAVRDPTEHDGSCNAARAGLQ